MGTWLCTETNQKFSSNNKIELFNTSSEITIKDFKGILLNFIDETFNGNENFKKIINSSAFCSEDNNIVSDSYQITKDQKIGIIPPIGGG